MVDPENAIDSDAVREVIKSVSINRGVPLSFLTGNTNGSPEDDNTFFEHMNNKIMSIEKRLSDVEDELFITGGRVYNDGKEY